MRPTGEELLERLADHRDALDRFVYEQTRGAVSVEDVVQETLARATAAIRDGLVDMGDASMGPWLRGLADGVLRETLRGHSTSSAPSLPLSLPNPKEDPDGYVETLKECFGEQVRSYVLKMCANGHLSDDIVSETFERALRSTRRDGVCHGAPMAWLRTIARNLLTDHYRRAVTRHETSFYTPPETGEAEPADARMLRQESARRMEEALALLTPGQRQAVEMRTLDGFTTPEVAAQMGRSEQAVRSLIHKAMKTLADFYREHPDDVRQTSC